MTNKCVIKLPKLHPKQLIAFNSPATDLLYGGSTRCGKSYFVRHALIKWCSIIPGLQCDMFRLFLDDIIAEAMQSETGFPVLLSEWAKAGLVKINQTEVKFWNGSLISLEHASDPQAVMLKHQGIGKHVRVFVESTQIDVGLIKWLCGWVTMSAEMKSRVPKDLVGRFPRIIHVSNPIGKSAAYYRREYVKAREPYQIELVGEFTRQYIPALVEDNPSEDAEATRRRVGEIGDQAVADALLNANWDALVGDFLPEWDEARHVVHDFTPPQYWFRYRAYDWGTADPAYCAYIAISDGEPFKDSDNNERWFPRGAMIVYNEWYIADPNDPAKGLRLRNEDMARGIVQRAEYQHRNVVTLCDSKPFQDMGGHGIAQTFEENGCPLTLADTSRVAGWSQLRSRLIGIEYNTDSATRLPMIYFCACCKAARDYIPALARHPSESKKEDAVEHGEATHTCDTIRYACMAHANQLIKDNVVPMQSKIERAVKVSRPTVKKILGYQARSIFS